jgi:hypothetical protein
MRHRSLANHPLATLLLLAAAALPGHDAAAQAAPPNLRPTRDVAVTYDVRDGRQPPRRVPVAWQAATQRIRASPQGLPGWVLVDLPQSRALMVMDAQGMAVNLPAGDMTALLGGIPPGTRLAAAGSATVAGLRCSLWRVTRTDVQGTVCLTDDGVMLRAEGTHNGRAGRVEALDVAYGRQNPARFTVPSGYTAMTLPPALLSGLLRGG